METSFLQKGRSRVHPCDFVENGLHHTDYLAWVLQVTSFSYFGKLSVRYHYYSFYNSLKMACLEYVVYRTFSSKDDFHCVTDNVYIWMPMPMSIPMPRCRCRGFQIAFYRFIGDHLLRRTAKWLLLNIQR